MLDTRQWSGHGAATCSEKVPAARTSVQALATDIATAAKASKRSAGPAHKQRYVSSVYLRLRAAS
eukprot:6180051-Pleurochrysis_carterae.AAC.1